MLTEVFLQLANGRHKDFVFDIRVLIEPGLTVIDVIERGSEQVVVQFVRRQIFNNDALQFGKTLLHLAMVLRKGVDIVIVHHYPLQQLLYIGKHGLLFIAHVLNDFMRILVIKLQNKLCQAVVFVQCFGQLFAHEGQLKLNVIGMRGLEIFEQSGHRDVLGLVLSIITINGKINNSQERIGVNVLAFAHLLHGFIAETQTNAKATKAL